MENNVFLMEAFMYRCHPQTAKLVELIRRPGQWRSAPYRACVLLRRRSAIFQSRASRTRIGGGGISGCRCYPGFDVALIAGRDQRPERSPSRSDVKGHARMAHNCVIRGDRAAQIPGEFWRSFSNSLSV
jgi:hypothetical protein